VDAWCLGAAAEKQADRTNTNSISV